MKKIIRNMILPVALLTGCGSYILAADPVWQALGSKGFSNSYVWSTTISIDHNDVPYVAFENLVDGNAKVTVEKYNGSIWEVVGNDGFSSGGLWEGHLSLAHNSGGIPYVAYMEDGYGDYIYRATSMKYDSVNDIWVLVGEAGFAPPPDYLNESAYDVSLALDKEDTPLVVYTRADSSFAREAELYNYSSTNGWRAEGQRVFTDTGTKEITIAISSDNTRYVAYREESNSDKVSVKKKSPSSYSWSNVGSAQFSAGGVKYVSIALNSTDTPYVAYKDLATSSKTTVMKYDGSNWVTVGLAGFSSGVAEYVSLAIDGSDTPYVAYSSSTDVGNITVMKYDGSNWVVVGEANFSSGRMNRTSSLALDSKGTPYVVYRDASNVNKATVMYAPSITCKRKDQDGKCIPGIEDPGWTDPYPDEPYDGNYDQGNGIDEGSRTLEPEVPQPYPEVPCDGTHEQGSNECATP